MTLLKPQLTLKRLVITSKGKTVYDERFHHGVNIIRGQNSSGKSTIADFIFYVLGGEIHKFKPEAERCDEVVAEIEISNNSLVLRRHVQIGARQPILMFWGNFEQASSSAIEGWQTYNVKRSANRESASQVLFRALEFPEVKTDLESNITMHQILRLIYIDQLSSVQSLMRDEDFDTGITRQTVGDLLLGIYDDRLYDEVRLVREKSKVLEGNEDQLKALYHVVGSTNLEVSKERVNEEVRKFSEELTRLDAQITEATESQTAAAVSSEMRALIQDKAEEYRRAKAAVSRMKDELQRIELEVEDSELFIDELRQRIAALDDSLSTRRILVHLPLTCCPHCLSPLPQSDSKERCPLCQQNLPETPKDSSALRMHQELAQQLRESEQLLTDKQKVLEERKQQLPLLSGAARRSQREYEELVQQVRPARDARIDQLLIRKGTLKAEITNLQKQGQVASLIESLEKKKVDIKAEIQALEISIQRRKQAQEANLQQARSTIEKYTLEILRNDLSREEMFKLGREVKIDFANNTFAIDGRNQFSASSIVYLKNSVHFGIFFASLELAFFRYPRFILCDNTEDKGMEEARSQNFQRFIVKLSKNTKVQHQIILTTSMIDPSLDTPEFCVGPAYNQTRKSLKFQ
jgi:hypothetical protein